MGKIKIVNKQGIEMIVSEKLAGIIGGVKPKILDKPPELKEVIKPLEPPVIKPVEPVKVEPVKVEKIEVTAKSESFGEQYQGAQPEKAEVKIEPLAEPKPPVRPVKKSAAARKGGRK